MKQYYVRSVYGGIDIEYKDGVVFWGLSFFMIGYLNSIVKHCVKKNYHNSDYKNFDLDKLDKITELLIKFDIHFKNMPFLNYIFKFLFK